MEACIQDCMEDQLGKALLRRFDDTAETCRELATSIFNDLLKASVVYESFQILKNVQLP